MATAAAAAAMLEPGAGGEYGGGGAAAADSEDGGGGGAFLLNVEEEGERAIDDVVDEVVPERPSELGPPDAARLACTRRAGDVASCQRG